MGHSARGKESLDGLSQIFWLKTEWAWLALVQNPTALPNQVEPVGPTRISSLDAIVDTINQCGKLDAKLAHACACNKNTLRFILWTAEQNLVAHIRLHLPHIGGMRLKDIYSVESDPVAVLLGQFVQGGNLPPKGRSRVAAEDQDDRLVGPK